jgi:hypothetical protein
MYQSVSSYDFHNAFKLRGRETQFSYDALDLLFNYFEEIETEDHPIELDVIAICCDYSESSYKDIIEYYSLDKDSTKEDVIDYLQDNTSYIGESEEDNLVYLQF